MRDAMPCVMLSFIRVITQVYPLLRSPFIITTSSITCNQLQGKNADYAVPKTNIFLVNVHSFIIQITAAFSPYHLSVFMPVSPQRHFLLDPLVFASLCSCLLVFCIQLLRRALVSG